MTLVKKIKDKKVNFEFNKEFIKVVTDKIKKKVFRQKITSQKYSKKSIL